ncbi:50S ribosomal protein L25/general stress protein Ctc [Flammeovirga kamogawensis]|uniref:Large ribosomal subunit protein bL25 n=1 Tax=Flammeovirga kamogawensis TaxID=373891 RepID=A0ABX8GTI2_9BACT|nr:50S ribosomal protein L25/general stress protein Ctc [Flammeovirga kamogawensis]MBB6461339.1 large subunit ribosomal protein L25 [Flammeovirga kamogawensis]QWG06245.1 50S ribosomal protein L25/general stress protein Ctc [Flammeovirga kamogawensis]TRX68075.1 50S ribosomal protein L25/general stress protein Ctc [Flammeovirga kamogawensis]
MKTVEIVGYKREALGKKSAKDLRKEGLAPCVVYGGEEPIHFAVPMYLFKDIIYTPAVCFVKINIEGVEKTAILQDYQLHPISEVLLHADFLELKEDTPIKMDVPLSFTGKSPGIQQGGKLVAKIRKIKVKALPANMPESVEVSIEGMELGKSVRVGAIKPDNYEILYNDSVTVASVAIPRALRSAMDAAAE